MTGKRVIIGPRPDRAAEAAMPEPGQPAPFPEIEAVRQGEAGGMHPGDAAIGDAILPQAQPGAWRMLALGGLCGALAGGLVTAGAVLYAPTLFSLADPRLDGLEQRLAQVESRSSAQAASIDRLSGDIAGVLDDGEAIASSLAANRNDTEALRGQIARLGKEMLPAEDDRLPLMAIAVAQLRAAFVSGSPFEAELVNVYNLARDNAEMLPMLSALSGPSRAGVVSAAQLRRQLHELAALSPELRIGQPQTYYDYGLALVNEYVGVASAPYAVEQANRALTDADARLSQGDVPGAIAVLETIEPSIRQQFAAFFEAARTHERVRVALDDINSRAVLELQDLAARRGGE